MPIRSSISKGGEDADETETADERGDTKDAIKSQTLVNDGKIVNQHAKNIYNIKHIDTFYG